MESQEELSKIALLKMQAFFVSGALGAKRDEAQALVYAGDSIPFEGGVRWSIVLQEADKRLRGESESLDQALSDMIAVMTLLLETHAPDDTIVCEVMRA